MQRVQRTLIRIVKGPTGGFLASLGIAAVLGGVALATPAPPIASVPDHHPDAIAADPFGSYPTSNGVVVSSVATSSGGMRTDADPTGRGPVFDPPANGSGGAHGRPGSAGGSSSSGLRSAGATPAHHDARDDPPVPRSDRGQHHGPSDHQRSGSGDQGSGAGSGQSPGGQQGENGSSGASGGPADSGERSDGRHPTGGGDTDGSGSGSSGPGGAGDKDSDASSRR